MPLPCCAAGFAEWPMNDRQNRILLDRLAVILTILGQGHMSAPPAFFREGMRWLLQTDVKAN